METKRTNKISSHRVWCGLTILLSQFNIKLSKDSCSFTPLSPHFFTPSFWKHWGSTQRTNPWRNYIFFISFQMRRQRFNSNAGGRSTGTELYVAFTSTELFCWAPTSVTAAQLEAVTALPGAQLCSVLWHLLLSLLLQPFSKKFESLGSHLKSEAEIAGSLHKFFF